MVFRSNLCTGSSKIPYFLVNNKKLHCLLEFSDYVMTKMLIDFRPEQTRETLQWIDSRGRLVCVEFGDSKQIVEFFL